jgi:hypothetical protein
MRWSSNIEHMAKRRDLPWEEPTWENHAQTRWYIIIDFQELGLQGVD